MESHKKILTQQKIKLQKFLELSHGNHILSVMWQSIWQWGTEFERGGL